MTGSSRRSEPLAEIPCATAVFEPTANINCGTKRSQPCHAALVSIEHPGESGTNRRIDQEKRHGRIEKVIQATHGVDPNKCQADRDAQPESYRVNGRGSVGQRKKLTARLFGVQKCLVFSGEYLPECVGVPRIRLEGTNFVPGTDSRKLEQRFSSATSQESDFVGCKRSTNNLIHFFRVPSQLPQ